MKRVLVTGGTGFIGSAIVRDLLSEGNYVRVLDDNSRGKEDRLSDLLDDIDLRTGSIQDEDKVSRACIGVDQVIHLAYINGTKTFYERPSLVLDVAVRGFSVLADAMRDRGVNRLVLASSSEVYQSPSLFPTPEEVEMVVPSLENPRYSYGLGKIFQEFYSYHAMPFLDELLIFRPHNIYGPDMGNLHVVPQLIEKCTKAKKLGSTFYIQGDGSQTRSFCYIDDFILGFRLILQSENQKMVFNIGNDSEISILEVAQHIAALVDYRGEIGFSAVPQGATSRRLPDISRLRSLGYTPTVSLSQGLAECVRQFSNV